MRPITVQVGPVGTVSANNIATSQTPGAAGALTLNGSLAVTTLGVKTAVLPTPQRILITTTDTTTKFTVVGQTSTGALLTEVLTGGGSTAASALDYAVITAITVNQGTTAAVTVGTNGIASAWIRLDEWANSYVTIACDVTGTVNYTIQGTMDDPNSPWGTPPLPSALNWVNSSDTAAVGATANLATNYLFSPTFIRVLLNSGNGSVKMIAAQAEVVGR